MKHKYLVFICTAIITAGCNNEKVPQQSKSETGKDWPVYGGNKKGNRYSPLSQINKDNVKNLQVAWMYDARDPSADSSKKQGEIQCQPIVVNGILYGTTPGLNLFAVDAATGKQLWKFESVRKRERFNTSRGVMYWENGDDKRILYAAGEFVYAVHALTGKPISSFGIEGKVNLHEGLGEGLDHDVQNLSVTATSPGVIYKNTMVIGSSVSEAGDAAPGHVRGFDVVTGKLKWTFHTIPHPGEPGYETWPKDAYKRIGAANSWSGVVADEGRGLVYFGTGSPASDFYGGDRKGTNLYANCIMALEAETGKMRWYYQTIHHDLWDRDISCPPNLATINRNGKKVDVVVQATKDGLVYVLDRDSGESIFPVEERPVPTAGLPGEHPWPTQKYPVKPAPFARQVFTEDQITNISPEAHAYVKMKWAEFGKQNNKFLPPSEKGTLLFGYSGGAEWGGNSVDPEGILYQNSNEDFWELVMVNVEKRKKELSSLSEGNRLYVTNCAACHGADRKGSGNVFPSLENIGARRNAQQIKTIVTTGSGRMPAFQHLSEGEREAIAGFLLNKERKVPQEESEHSVPQTVALKKDGFPYEPLYVNKTWRRFVDQDGYNAIKPPWGTLNAIDLNTGEYLWRVPLGEFPELTKKGIPPTGTETYGGPIVTASGLLFIASTKDERIRAFDKKTGKVVWEYQLPAGGFATPITYEVGGKQYLAIACGGGRGRKPGGWYVAFALK